MEGVKQRNVKVIADEPMLKDARIMRRVRAISAKLKLLCEVKDLIEESVDNEGFQPYEPIDSCMEHDYMASEDICGLMEDKLETVIQESLDLLHTAQGDE